MTMTIYDDCGNFFSNIVISFCLSEFYCLHSNLKYPLQDPCEFSKVSQGIMMSIMMWFGKVH